MLVAVCGVSGVSAGIPQPLKDRDGDSGWEGVARNKETWSNEP